MPKRFYLRHKDTIIGYFVEREDELVYKPIHSTARTLKGGLGYPLGLYPLDKNSKKLLPVIDYTPTRDDIEHWLSERVFPEDREGAWELLERLGLSEYDRWEIAKRINATSYNDYYWMSEDPEDVYERVNPRYKMELYFAWNLAKSYEDTIKSLDSSAALRKKLLFNLVKRSKSIESEMDKSFKEISLTTFDDDEDDEDV